MPFRCRQRSTASFCFGADPIVSSSDDSGNFVDKYRENNPLPPVENFRLQNLLKAGVPLEEVNTKILGASSLDLSSLVSKSKDVKSSEVVEPHEDDKIETEV